MPKTQSAPQQDACFRTCLHKKHLWIFEHNLPKKHVYTLGKTSSQPNFPYSYENATKTPAPKHLSQNCFLDAVSSAQTQKSEAVCRSVSKSMQKTADQMAVSASGAIWKFCILSNRKHLYIYYNIVFAICQPFSAQKPAKMQIVNTLTTLYPFQKYCYKKCTAFSFSPVSRQIYIFC